MEEMITLTFTEEQKYQLEFSPPSFWLEFARGYSMDREQRRANSYHR